MDNFHFLISYLIALQANAKDFHYNCRTFGEHLYADLVQDDLYDYIDQIKENVFLGSKMLPYSAARYLTAAVPMIMPMNGSDAQNLELLMGFIEFGQVTVNRMEGNTRGQNALLDEIAAHLDKAHGLAFLQFRKFDPETEVQESAKVEHCKACIEKAVDRAKATLAKINDKKVAGTVLDYEAKNLLVAEEEDTLDKLSKKLGV